MELEQIRNWIVVVYLGLTGISWCIVIAYCILIALKVSSIMEAARETMRNIRGD